MSPIYAVAAIDREGEGDNKGKFGRADYEVHGMTRPGSAFSLRTAEFFVIMRHIGSRRAKAPGTWNLVVTQVNRGGRDRCVA